jgi:catechol 2,3-dioxygenase-like lactoylglutathione lyase family enzyme
MGGLRHAGLIVNDAEKALTLYRDILNFNPKVDQIESDNFFQKLVGIDGAIARTIKCYSIYDDSCIEIIEYKTPDMIDRAKDINSLGFNHIAINTNNLKDLSIKLKAIGLSFINEPSVNLDETAMVAFCYDFEGNLLELVELINV